MSEELFAIRKEKIDHLRKQGINPYPERFDRSHRIHEVHTYKASLHTKQKAETEKAKKAQRKPNKIYGETVRLAGRVTLCRSMGKLTFATIQDIDGKIQISLQQNGLDQNPDTSHKLYKQIQKTIDLGDFIGIEGPLFLTNKGELTVRTTKFTFLGKCLRPLPSKWQGLKDQELARRQRYLDLISNAESRTRFRKRHQIIKTIRRFLDDHQFEEVETPILCEKASGAMARPFIAHHNSLDRPVYLRIAPETYLKRLIIAGFDRVYEFARCFRNEGMDPSHLQDFTMLEFYASYWNYQDNMAFTQRLLQHVVTQITGGLTIKIGSQNIDFSGEWPRHSIRDLISKHSGLDINNFQNTKALLQAIDEKNIPLENKKTSRGNLIDQLYKKTVRPKLIQPLFLIQHPKDLSPLARSNDENPDIADRFQVVVNTWEIVNAYSELVDPIEQRKRLEEQRQAKAKGDQEAMDLDEDYLLAMEFGMPPISGWGLGIDRLTALLTHTENLRDTVFFPLLKPV